MAHAHAIGFSLSAREPMDVSRIAACAGTIAINVALILLLLAPLSGRLPDLPSSAKDPVLVLWQPPRPKIVEPPVPVPVLPQPQTATTQPVRQPQHVAPVDTPVVDPQSGDIAIEPPDIAPGPEPTLDPVPSSGEQLQALRSPPPPYPAEAMRNGLSGVVELEIRVGVDGRPLDVRIVRSSGHRVLDQAARRTVLSKWTFVPATRDGHAVEALGRVPIEFVL
jgi:protein TonB